MLTKTALLFFTRTAASEAANKTFVTHNKRSNRKVASLLINNTRRIVGDTDLPTFEINEQQQVGSSFGDRLTNAIESVFKNGFEKVIVIGNDCLQLTGTRIKEVDSKLQQHDLVLGPDNHGGVYLIGIHKSIFDKASFSSLQWQTPHVFEDLQICFAHTPFYQLPVLKDANNFFDLIELNRQLPSFNCIKAFIISLLASGFERCFYLPRQYTSQLFLLAGLRAPPVFCI